MKDKQPWFANATLPRLPAPYFWQWTDEDINLTINKNNIHKEDGAQMGLADEVVAYIFFHEGFYIRYLGIGTNLRRQVGYFDDVQTSINTLYARFLMGEWE